MKKEEIKRMVEDDIESQCDESGLTREEVIEPVFYGLLDRYVKDIITLEDLIQAAKIIDIEVVVENLIRFKQLKIEEKQKRKEAKQKRKERRIKK